MLSPHARIIALVVAAALFAQFLDGVIIVTALPRMAQEFGVSTLEMSLGVTIYMLAITICIPAASWLADGFGARRVFVASIIAFTVASLACGLANNLPLFVAARALQGIGGAVLFPVGRILVLRSAEKSEIVAAIGLTIWPALFAPVIGPALGGFITEYASWQWNFWINVPLGIINTILVLALVPADTEFKKRPFDVVGFLLTAVALGGLLYGFDGLMQGSFPLPLALGLLALAALFGFAAIRWLLRAPHPLVELRTFAIPTFAATDLRAGAIARIGINSAPFLLPLMFQIGYGLDAFQGGALVVAYFLGNLVMKAVTTPILRVFGFRNVLVVNGVLAGILLGACAVQFPGISTVGTTIALFLAGAARSMQFTALATLAFADVDASQRSAATTLSSMSQQLSQVMAVAVAAGMLNLSRIIGGRADLALADFNLALLGCGALVILSSLSFLRLAPRAGAEVSGHGRPIQAR